MLAQRGGPISVISESGFYKLTLRAQRPQAHGLARPRTTLYKGKAARLVDQTEHAARLSPSGTR
jgi:hypothetical protein